MDASAIVAGGFESVTSYLAWDHDRLDEGLRSVSSAVGKGRFAEAAAGYEEFEHGLLRHLRIEEELIFPVFEARSGMTSGPTDVMRDEHRHVRQALQVMRRGLQGSDADGYEDGLRFFDSVLPDHNAKEEHILYPTLDRLLRPAERAALVSRLQRESAR
ncbi:MAG TPA: hemerythrin domain-containing protein [Vicinamibacteria bacterium]|nr:hemerythrin domain-containing protein [Vicinamibacteria bacterium]